MRKRNRELLLRLTENEYNLLTNRIKMAGVTKQKYLLDLVFNNDIQSAHMDGDHNSSKDKMKQFIITKIGVTRYNNLITPFIFRYKYTQCYNHRRHKAASGDD